ncbi:GTP 3',8-cyclase MoaA [Thermohalobacter berrensis]|uniref:GTP 3',8-cyclase n=1 Tax=Thermohalobacter berrensis TaxID=99594 RepID=A0A419T2C3_9FIRM|nr:GTP 3',8-cyclase MoaA [Thermohalobacter berrensis]RKD31647.1 cyclic pyranopterin phosphate synthase MoaA [Thermohalobacter berrensis]
MRDSFGRMINYLRISVTDLCNLRCMYCMPQKGICKLKHKNILRIEEIKEIAKTFVALGVNKIRLTGGEPLARRGMISLIKDLANLDGLKDLAITTNGTLLKKFAKDLKNAGLKRVNISLDTLNDDKYSFITRGGKLKDVLEGIQAAKRVGLSPIKINVVLIKGFNEDEIEDFLKFTEDGIDVRFIELMPVGEASNWALERFISNEIVLNKVKDLVKVENINPSSPAVYYRLNNNKGRIGLINPISCKFCNNCNKVRLTSTGSLKLCLHSNREIDLKGHLRKGSNLKNIIIKAIKEKPESHYLEDGTYIEKNMFQIGG